MATHSSILAWRIPCTEEPGGPQSMGSQSQTRLSNWHSLSQGASMNGQVESESRWGVSDTLRPLGLYSPWNSPGQDTGVGSHSLLHGIFPAPGLNPDLPHCRWILYHLSHQGSLRILKWVAYPFSSRSSPPRNWARVSCIAGRLYVIKSGSSVIKPWTRMGLQREDHGSI